MLLCACFHIFLYAYANTLFKYLWWETAWWLLKKLKTQNYHISKQFHIPSYTSKITENRHSNNCIQMCTAVQSATAKKQKPKRPSTNERTNCRLPIQRCIIQSQKPIKYRRMPQGQTLKTRGLLEGPTHTIRVCEMLLTQRIQSK